MPLKERPKSAFASSTSKSKGSGMKRNASIMSLMENLRVAQEETGVLPTLPQPGNQNDPVCVEYKGGSGDKKPRPKSGKPPASGSMIGRVEYNRSGDRSRPKSSGHHRESNAGFSTVRDRSSSPNRPSSATSHRVTARLTPLSVLSSSVNLDATVHKGRPSTAGARLSTTEGEEGPATMQNAWSEDAAMHTQRRPRSRSRGRSRSRSPHRHHGGRTDSNDEGIYEDIDQKAIVTLKDLHAQVVKERRLAIEKARSEEVVKKIHDFYARTHFTEDQEKYLQLQQIWMQYVIVQRRFSIMTEALNTYRVYRAKKLDSTKVFRASVTLSRWWTKMLIHRKLKRYPISSRILTTIVHVLHRRVTVKKLGMSCILISRFLTDCAALGNTMNRIYNYRRRVVRVQRWARAFIACTEARLKILWLSYVKWERKAVEETVKREEEHKKQKRIAKKTSFKDATKKMAQQVINSEEFRLDMRLLKQQERIADKLDNVKLKEEEHLKKMSKKAKKQMASYTAAYVIISWAQFKADPNRIKHLRNILKIQRKWHIGHSAIVQQKTILKHTYRDVQLEHVRAFLFHSTEQDGNGLEELAAVMLPASKARKQWAKSGKKHSDPDHNPMDDEVEEKKVRRPLLLLLTSQGCEVSLRSLSKHYFMAMSDGSSLQKSHGEDALHKRSRQGSRHSTPSSGMTRSSTPRHVPAH